MLSLILDWSEMPGRHGNESSYVADGIGDIKWDLSHHVVMILEISEVDEKRKSKGRLN